MENASSTSWSLYSLHPCRFFLSLFTAAVFDACLVSACTNAPIWNQPKLTDSKQLRGPPTSRQPAPLSQQELALSSYIAERWNVEQSDANRVVLLARESARAHQLDHFLVLAVIARESAFQYVGNAGNYDIDLDGDVVDPRWAHGLMQIAGRFHEARMPVGADGKMRVTTDAENIDIGSGILREYIDRDHGNLRSALQRYNGNLADETARFATYVLRVRKQFERAAHAD